jgi:hypothetical protein
MAQASRAQIEAAFALPKNKLEVEYSGTWYEVSVDSILDASGSSQITGSKINGLSTGVYNEPEITIKLWRKTVIATLNKAVEDVDLERSRVRFSHAYATSDYEAIYVGVLKGIEVKDDDVSWEVGSIFELFLDQKIYIDAYLHRHCATATTTASEEDPTDGNYQAGFFNHLMWEAGGRPLEQRGINYAANSVPFWYTAEHSAIQIPWSWMGGEDLVEELFSIARASGAQIYQYVDTGEPVVKFVPVLSFGDISNYGGSYYNFTNGTFGSFSKGAYIDEIVSTVRCSYAARRLFREQIVYEDNNPRTVKVGETVTFDLDMSLPVFEYKTINSDAFEATWNHTPAAVDLDTSVTIQSASRVQVEVTNNTSYPATIHKVIIYGKPLGVEEKQTVSYGSGDPEIDLEDNPLIQTRSHAMRLVRMVHDFNSTPRAMVTLNNCPYDPDRYLGEIVRCNNDDNISWNGSAWVSTTELYRITSLSYNEAGDSMDVTLISIDGLPVHDDMYIVDETYISTDVRKLSY